ncbi:hypothetical protein ANN_03257 [Periplaneta americana]|uniref:Endonuclease/exonuclease/phosphatase domain-containing protein n=1 Tax=Periplaneta americana TaxID=6978 RepID=A0ABQ8U3T5_PERAM|nr:hypothetical protein ANN_03257 [Periplaneta americana]
MELRGTNKCNINAYTRHISKYDAVVLTETYLMQEWHSQNFYAIHNFATQGSRGRPRGGISLLLKPKLTPFQTLHKTENILLVKCGPIWIMCGYFQPYLKEEEIIDEIEEAIVKVPRYEPLLIAGDLNCRLDTPLAKTENVLSYINSEGLSVVNNKTEKTYYSPNGSSTIDLVFVNEGTKVISHKVITNVAVRKHLPVETILQLGNTFGTTETSRAKIPRKLDVGKIQEKDLENVISIIQEGDVDTALETIEKRMKEAIPHHKDNTCTRKAKPWFNAECYSQRKATLNALHSARELKTEAAYRNYADKRREYKETVREAKTTYHLSKEKKLIEEAESDPYKALRQKNPRFPKTIPIQTWTQHLSSIVGAKDTRPKIDSSPAVGFEPINEEEVTYTIKMSRPNRAPGPNHITNEHLKLAVQSWCRHGQHS